jgi:hypothetical protein
MERWMDVWFCHVHFLQVLLPPPAIGTNLSEFILLPISLVVLQVDVSQWFGFLTTIFYILFVPLFLA